VIRFTDKYPREIKCKTNKYNTEGTIPKSNKKIVERCKIGTLAHKYMTAHFSGLVLALQ
jgi:hypothetical protein